MNALRAAELRQAVLNELRKCSPGASGPTTRLLARLCGARFGEMREVLDGMQASQQVKGRELREHGPVQWVPWGFDELHEPAARRERERAARRRRKAS